LWTTLDEREPPSSHDRSRVIGILKNEALLRV
jgi:hypothetical protein